MAPPGDNFMVLTKRLLYSALGGLLLTVVVVSLAVYLLFPSDEVRILRVIADGEKAIESEDREGTLSHISLQYRDDMDLTYPLVKRILTDSFTRFENFEVTLHTTPAITVQDGAARAVFDITVRATLRPAQGRLLQGSRGYLVGSAEEPSHLTLTFAKERFAWRVIKTEGVRVPFLE